MRFIVWSPKKHDISAHTQKIQEFSAEVLDTITFAMLVDVPSDRVSELQLYCEKHALKLTKEKIYHLPMS